MQSPGYPSARKQITYRMETKTLQNFIHALHYSEKSLYSHQKRLGKSSNFGRPSFKRSTNFLLRRFRMNPLLLIQVGRHLSHLRHKRWIMEHEAPARGSSHATWPIYERQGTIANMLWQKLCLHWCSILRYPSLSVLLEDLSSWMEFSKSSFWNFTVRLKNSYTKNKTLKFCSEIDHCLIFNCLGCGNQE